MENRIFGPGLGVHGCLRPPRCLSVPYVRDLRDCGLWCSQDPGADPPGHQGTMEVKVLGVKSCTQVCDCAGISALCLALPRANSEISIARVTCHCQVTQLSSGPCDNILFFVDLGIK